ncbi:MAG TPA: hypothetical protein VK898_10925 [Chloroflexota bacterium]|nr:hypothetical protein [Chloroflexota bacterium]
MLRLRRMLLHRRWMGTIAAVTCLLALGVASCAPANERPLSGAQPGTLAPTPPGIPPTLEPSEALRFRALPSPSPGVAANPSPVPSTAPVVSPSAVAAPPIVRTIVPGANTRVPAGAPVTLSAVLVGRGADLAAASLSIDGADAAAQVDKRSARDWTIHASRAVGSGNHTVHVLVRDASGAAGGFTWQFLVGDEERTPVPST